MSQQQQKIINPETGRKISVNGPTYQALLSKGTYDLASSPRYSGKKPHKRYQETTPLPTANMQLSPIYSLDTGFKGNRTRGWGAVAPKRGKERQQLFDRCGSQCFLIPEKQSFPICQATGPCQLDCRALAAAKIRAHQWKYTNLYNHIDSLGKEKCAW